MMYWLTSKERKTHQRAMTNLLKQVNKCLKEDEMWKDRFDLRQVDAQWGPYEDHSGEELYVRLKMIDHKTGHFVVSNWESVNHWRFMGGHNVYAFVNDFIIQA